MDQVNERTTLMVTVAFFDEDDVAVVPSAATYRLDDVTSGTTIKSATAIAPLGTTAAIHILKGWNSIFSEAHPYETRRLTIEFTYGSNKQGTAEYIYRVKNLPGVTLVASASVSASASASAS